MFQASFWSIQIFLHTVLSATLPVVNIISTSDDDELYSMTSPTVMRQTSDKMIFHMSSFSQSPSDGTLSPASPAELYEETGVRDVESPSNARVIDFLAEALSDLNANGDVHSDSEYGFWNKSPSHPYVISQQDIEALDTPGRNERAMFYKKVTEPGVPGSLRIGLHQKQVRLESRPSPVSPQSLEEDVVEMTVAQHHRGHRSMSDISDVIHHHVHHPSDPLPVGTPKYPSNVSSIIFLKDHHLK